MFFSNLGSTLMLESCYRVFVLNVIVNVFFVNVIVNFFRECYGKCSSVLIYSAGAFPLLSPKGKST